MRNPICMLQQLNWMRMEIARGSLSDLTGWLKRWCSFCRERKSLCLPLSACQCNYNHMRTRGGPWYPVDYGLNNMLEMRSVSLGLSCVRTGAVMYVYFCICLVRWIGSSTYWFPDGTPTKNKKNKGTNHWLIHNTNFGLKFAPEGFEIWASSKNRTCGNSISLQLHSFLLTLSKFQCIFQAAYPAIFQKRHLGANRIQPQSSSALPDFLLKLPLRVLPLRSHRMSGSSLQLKQRPHDQTPTSLRVRER